MKNFYLTIWFAIYIGLLAMYQLISYFEHRKYSEKKQRYHALPLRFKLACALIALPIFATSIYSAINGYEALQYVWIIAVVIALWIEQKAINWYRKNGLF